MREATAPGAADPDEQRRRRQEDEERRRKQYDQAAVEGKAWPPRGIEHK